MSERLHGSFQISNEAVQAMLPPGVQTSGDGLTGVVQSVEGNKAVILCEDDPFAEPVEPLPKPGPIEHIATMPNGVWIYRQTNSADGHTYFSDAIDGGVMVWDTCMVSAEELCFVMALEEEGREIEREIESNPEIQERIANRERLLNDSQALDALIETIRSE